MRCFILGTSLWLRFFGQQDLYMCSYSYVLPLSYNIIYPPSLLHLSRTCVHAIKERFLDTEQTWATMLSRRRQTSAGCGNVIALYSSSPLDEHPKLSSEQIGLFFVAGRLLITPFDPEY